MNKKILIFGFIILVIIGLLIYFVIGKKSPPTPAGTTGTTQPAKGEGIGQFYSQPISSPALAKDGKSIFYLNTEKAAGDFGLYQLDLVTKKTKLLKQFTSTPESATWSLDLTKVILQTVYQKDVFEETNDTFKSPGTEDGTKTAWIYDLLTQKLSQLPNDIASVSWSSDGTKILGYFFKPAMGINNLSLISPNGIIARKLTELSASEGVGLGFASPTTIYYYPLSFEATTAGNNIYLLNISTLKTQELVSGNQGGAAVASPSGKKIIYQFLQPDGQKLLIVANSDGSDKKNLGIYIDPQKITFAKDDSFIVAAVKQENSKDKFYKINLATLQKQEIPYDISTNVDAKNLMLSPDGKTLYFTSDNYLYKMTLP